MTILGIDPGIADTGYGIIQSQNGRLSCADYGSIKTSPKLSHSERLLIIGDELTALIKKYRPSVVGVEKLFFCNNLKTAVAVGQARGVVLYILEKYGIALKEFTPLQVKQAVSSYGKADKKQVQAMVKILLNLKEIPKPDDAADALAVAICASSNHSLF